MRQQLKPELRLNVTRREAALIFLIRKIGFGTINKLGVKNSQPDVIVTEFQRLDLGQPDEMEAIIAKCATVDLTPAAIESDISTLKKT